MAEEFEWDRPIIIIGAGRSGTTMLSAVLGEHPDVYAAGETSFLLMRLWEEFFRRPEYVNEFRISKLIKNTRAEWRDMLWLPFRQMLTEGEIRAEELANAICISEEKRLSQCLGRFMAESLVPPELRRRFWSFKEIWNGSTSFPYGWDRHNLAFPKARFVHIVRHPWMWARSYFLNMKEVPSKNDFIFALSNWVSMVETACQQEPLGSRYTMVKLEDFKADPVSSVSALLSFLELPDNARCHAAAGYEYLPSHGNLALPRLSDKEVESIPRLVSLMERFGYSPPAG